MSRTIYLDMDGVSVDFVSGGCRILGYEHEPGRIFKPGSEESYDWPRGLYTFTDILPISYGDFWVELEKHGPEFWRNLAAYPWLMRLHDELSLEGEVIFCSDPTGSPNAIHGKTQWLQDRFGSNFRDFVFMPSRLKSRLARPGAFLIDDHADTVKAFNRDGGCGILFPQWWNNGSLEVDRLDIVRRALSDDYRSVLSSSPGTPCR